VYKLTYLLIYYTARLNVGLPDQV